MEIYELIANTPVDDGVVKCWHGCLSKAQSTTPSKDDIESAKKIQAGALEAFSADFNVWQNKRPALKIMQLKTDGPFKTGRKWYSQFFAAIENVSAIRAEVNGTHLTPGLPTPEEAGHPVGSDLPV